MKRYFDEKQKKSEKKKKKSWGKNVMTKFIVMIKKNHKQTQIVRPS